MQATISPNVLIRRMLVQDLDIVAKIEREVAVDPWDQKLFNSCLNIYDAVVAVAHDTRSNAVSVIGFGIIAIYGSIQEAHILNLGVDANWHRMGIGGELLGYLINICTSAVHDLQHDLIHTNQCKIFLEVNSHNQAAISLYSKFNFTQVGVRKNYYNVNGVKQDALTFMLQV